MGNIQNGATLVIAEDTGDAFHSFLNLDSGIYLAVNGTVTRLPGLF